MASTAISTFLRIRPAKKASDFFKTGDTDYDEDNPKGLQQVEVKLPPAAAEGMVNNRRSHWRFTFNGVLGPKSTQEEAYERICQPVVRSVLEGFNGTVFAYGQTGSGKTFTLTGGVDSYAQRGLIPRALSAVFAHVEASAEADYTVRISYLEIYNEHGFDLLDPSSVKGGSGMAQLPRVSGVVEEDDGSVWVRGLSTHVVTTEEQALNLLFIGDTNRAVSETSMNAASSRSHCIFTVSLESRPHGSMTVRRSKLQLVDLAGSERVAKTGAAGSTLQEAMHINTSLHYLELVILALHEKKKKSDRHVPYRNALLTSVLRDSLGGNCKTVMVAAMNPGEAHTEESISTCNFAQRVAQIKNDVSLNEEVDPEIMIARLKEENRRLKDANPGLDDGKALSVTELSELHVAVRGFIADTAPLPVFNFGKGRRAAKVRHALWILREMIIDRMGTSDALEALNAVANSSKLKQGNTDMKPGEGELQDPTSKYPESGGTAASDSETGGIATDDASDQDQTAELTRQVRQLQAQLHQRDELIREKERQLQLLMRQTGPTAAAPEATGSSEVLMHAKPKSHDGKESSERGGAAAQLAKVDARALQDRESAREVFVNEFKRGAELAISVRDSQEQLRAQLQRAKELGLALHASRDEIQSSRREVEVRRALRAAASVIPSGGDTDADAAAEAEEQQICAELDAQKDRYKARTIELKQLKIHCGALEARCKAQRAAFENEFELWWKTICEARGLPPPKIDEIDPSRSSSATHSIVKDVGKTKASVDGPTSQAEQRIDPMLGMHPKAAKDPRSAWESAVAPAETKASHALKHKQDERESGLTVALLQDPEASLSKFRDDFWPQSKSAHREGLKQQLNEACSTAKDLGELVARKKQSVTHLKQQIAICEDEILAAELKARLQMDTAYYKDAVQQLKELKGQIESVQIQLRQSQDQLQADFLVWHRATLARLQGGGDGLRAPQSQARRGAPVAGRMVVEDF